MNAKHTPGPWSYENGHGVTACGDPLKVAGRTKVAQANRALVSAAPDLLEALRAVVSVADRATAEFDMARAAISKATGGEA